MGRRRLLAISAITAASLALSACTAANDEASDTAKPDHAVVALDKFGTEAALPWTMTVPENNLWQGVYDFLIERDPVTWKPVPGLATEWSINEDSTIWTFKIREGVPFHGDYGDVTAADVKFTLEHLISEEALSPTSRNLRGVIESIDAPNATTLIINLNKPYFFLADELARSSGYVPITSEKYVTEVGEEAANKHPIGTGPFEFVDGTAGDHYDFAAVQDHWRKTPEFAQLTLRLMAEQTTRVNAVRAGEVDVAKVSGDAVALAKSSGLDIHETKNATSISVVLPGQTNADKPDYCPECAWVGDLNDPADQAKALKVRTALNLAINRKAIYEGVFSGFASDTPYTFFYLPSQAGHSDKWKLSEYDVEKAKKLLAEAGYPGGGFTIKINALGDNTYGPALTDTIASDLAKIGVTVQRVDEDMGTFVAKVRAHDTAGVGRVYVNPATIAEPVTLWALTLRDQGIGYYLANGLYQDNVNEVLAIADPDKRQKAAVKLGDKIHAAHHALDIGMISATWAISDKVGDWPTPAGVRDESNFEYMTLQG